MRAVKVLWLEYSAMPTRQNGLNSQLSGRRARSARARGLRTLQHQSLPRAIVTAIEAELWLRALIVERVRTERPTGAPVDPAWATKDQLHDEALSWFLRHPGDAARRPAPSVAQRPAASAEAAAAAPAGSHPAGAVRGRQGAHQDVTFWVDSRLLARARRRAMREGLRLAQFIERALDSYIAVHIPAEVLHLHRRTQALALRLHRRRSAPAGKREPEQ